MHKILLALILSIVFFFPSSEVFAEKVPECTKETIDTTSAKLGSVGGDCPDSYVCFRKIHLSGVGDVNYCYKSVIATTNSILGPCLKTVVPTCTNGAVPREGTVPLQKVCINGNTSTLAIERDLWTCTQSGALPTSQDDTCTCKVHSLNPFGNNPSTPTSGSGQMCYIAPGSKDDGKPIPLGLGPPLTGKTGIYTAIGCVPTEPKALVEGLLKYGTMAAGAIAFIMMLLGALGLITAEGNPEVVKASQEKFYSALIGLLLIIFSVLLMQVIGVDILGLPGFGRRGT